MKITYIFLFLFLIACQEKPDVKSRYKLVTEFLNNIKNGKYDKAENMIAKNPLASNSYGTMVYDIENSTYIIKKFGIPSQTTWKAEYDTSGELVKIVTYIIPIFKGYDSVSELEEATAKISFDYTGKMAPNLIFLYRLDSHKKRKKFY